MNLTADMRVAWKRARADYLAMLDREANGTPDEDAEGVAVTGTEDTPGILPTPIEPGA